MVVGQHQTPRGIDNDTGPQALCFALQRLGAEIEKAAEKRIVEQRIGLQLNMTLRRNVHHRRRDLFEHRRKTGQRLLPDCRRQSRLDTLSHRGCCACQQHRN